MIDTKALRQKILDLAMRGKLVPQDPNDEPVENLLARIKEERHHLEKEKKISKVIDSDIFWSDDDNCYYRKDEIPNGWSCLQLQYFSKIFTGNSLNDSQKLKFSVKVDNTFCYVSTKDIDLNGNVNYENGIYTPINEKLKIARAKSILICLEGANAGNKIAITDKDINFVNKLACVETFSVIEKFIYYFICSSVFNEEFRSNLQGIIGGVPLSKFKELSILIPPLQEQQRIVNKLDELFALIDKIEKEQEELEEYKKLAKEKVLELAVTGKLVKQDPNDEPASILLERIKKEKEELIKAGKIKKDKTDSEPLSDDDKNYYGKFFNRNISLVSFSSVLDVRDGTHESPKYHQSGFPFLTSKNLSRNGIDYSNYSLISEADFIKYNVRSKAENNDILFGMIGTIGNPCLIENPPFIFAFKNMALIKCFSNLIIPKFVLIYLYWLEKKFKNDSGGGVQCFISLSYIRRQLIPLYCKRYQLRVTEIFNNYLKVFELY